MMLLLLYYRCLFRYVRIKNILLIMMIDRSSPHLRGRKSRYNCYCIIMYIIALLRQLHSLNFYEKPRQCAKGIFMKSYTTSIRLYCLLSPFRKTGTACRKIPPPPHSLDDQWSETQQINVNIIS